MSDRPPRRPRPAPAPAPAPARNGTGPGYNRNGLAAAAATAAAAPRSDANHEILFQTYCKSVNPRRTYAAQVKRASNGNHYLVLTEGKPPDKTDELRLARHFLCTEDFEEFF